MKNERIEKGPRFGSSLADGCAHAIDHKEWSRRDFLSRLGLAAVGTGALATGLPVTAYGASPAMALANLETDRVLVLVQLAGGNDGLNTIVPFESDLYYNGRPRIAIPKADVTRWSDQLGIHPSLNTLDPLYKDGRLGVVMNVGYPEPVFSHFDATDIWVSASRERGLLETGWTGRYLESSLADPEARLERPLAMEIGRASTMFKGANSQMGVSVVNTRLFEQIAETGLLYDETAVPESTYGEQMAFVRSVANDSFRFAGVIQEASDASENDAEYTNTAFGNSLGIVARMIKGRLGSKIYQVQLSGFDTHSNQLNIHRGLMSQLADNLQAFISDLEATGDADRVMVMTYSEFGRRPFENGSRGTDHGSVAPVFLLGSGLSGGIVGSPPPLDDLDETSNMKYETDFRSIYGTVLADWFGLGSEGVDGLMGGRFDRVPIISAAVNNSGTEIPGDFERLRLLGNYPNPAQSMTTIEFETAEAGQVSIDLLDTSGRSIRNVHSTSHPRGRHQVMMNVDGLPAGTYFYRVTTAAGSRSRALTVVR